MDETLFLNILKYILSLAFIIGVFVPFCLQGRLYYPSKQLFTVNNLNYEDIFILTEDKEKINAWYSAPTKKDITVLFCHGNGGNISFYGETLRLLQEQGYGFLALDYRGYGKSTGFPSEKGLYRDLRAAVNFLKKENTLLWGLSLGGAVVAQIASESPKFRGVILQSTFTSINEMASYMFHKVFFKFKGDYYGSITDKILKRLPLHHKYDTKSKISRIKSPLLLVHAIPDNIIPVEMTIKLANINPKAKLFISPEGGHNEQSWFYPKLFEFLGSLNSVNCIY